MVRGRASSPPPSMNKARIANIEEIDMRCAHGRFTAVSLAGAVVLMVTAPATAEDVAAPALSGKQVYATKTCLACHGKEGRKAIQDYPDLAGQKADYMAAQIKDIIAGKRTGSADATGNPRANAMRGALIDPEGKIRITDDEIAAVSTWLAANKPRDPDPGVPPMAEDKKAEAAKLFADNCAACHGATGREPLEGFPAIAGQKRAYLLAQVKDIKSNARANGQAEAMQGAIAELSDQQIELVAEYVSLLPAAAQ